MIIKFCSKYIHFSDVITIIIISMIVFVIRTYWVCDAGYACAFFCYRFTGEWRRNSRWRNPYFFCLPSTSNINLLLLLETYPSIHTNFLSFLTDSKKQESERDRDTFSKFSKESLELILTFTFSLSIRFACWLNLFTRLKLT